MSACVSPPCTTMRWLLCKVMLPSIWLRHLLLVQRLHQQWTGLFDSSHPSPSLVVLPSLEQTWQLQSEDYPSVALHTHYQSVSSCSPRRLVVSIAWTFSCTSKWSRGSSYIFQSLAANWSLLVVDHVNVALFSTEASDASPHN